MYLRINEIHQGDARDLLPQIEPDSIACSVWSPPYHLGKDYEKDFTYEGWVSLLNEVIRLQFRHIVQLHDSCMRWRASQSRHGSWNWESVLAAYTSTLVSTSSTSGLP